MWRTDKYFHISCVFTQPHTCNSGFIVVHVICSNCSYMLICAIYVCIPWSFCGGAPVGQWDAEPEGVREEDAVSGQPAAHFGDHSKPHQWRKFMSWDQHLSEGQSWWLALSLSLSLSYRENLFLSVTTSSAPTVCSLIAGSFPQVHSSLCFWLCLWLCLSLFFFLPVFISLYFFPSLVFRSSSPLIISSSVRVTHPTSLPSHPASSFGLSSLCFEFLNLRCSRTDVNMRTG